MQELTVKQISERLGYDIKIVKEQPKPPEVFYKRGDWFKVGGKISRLVQTDPFKVALIAEGGNRWSDPQTVGDITRITEAELKSCASTLFKIVPIKVEVKEIS